MKKKIKAMAGYGMKKKSTKKGYMKAQSGPSMSTPKVGSRRRVTDTYDPSVEYIPTDRDFGRKENEALAAKKELMRKKAAATAAGYNKSRAGGAKPDYLDMDGDGNRKESMKSAIRSKKGTGGYMKAQAGPGNALAGKGAKLGKMAMAEARMRKTERKPRERVQPVMGKLPPMKANQSFIEPATPRMFEDGGLKDLRKEQRGERKQLRSKNKKLKSSAKDIAKATKRGTRTASKTIKRINKKSAKTARKNTRSAAKDIRQTSRKNIAALKGRGAKTQENKSAATNVSVAAKEEAPKLEKMTTRSAGKLPVDRRTGTVPPPLAGGTSGGNALARQKGETSRAKDDLARKNKTGQYETYSQAYRKQRDANKKAGIANYGNPKGYFTYKGKKYNTESKSEKAARLKKGEKKPKAKAEEGFKFE